MTRNTFEAKGSTTREQDLETIISEGIDATEWIIKSWERGDLADAVRHLREWAVEASTYLQWAVQQTKDDTPSQKPSAVQPRLQR